MPILQPHEMDFKNKNFSMIIAGSPGVGKTTLAMSAPNPVLFDFDKGVSRVRAQHRKATAVVATYEELLADMESEAIKKSDTLVVDTGGSFITYLHDWAERKDARLKKNKLQRFGVVKDEFNHFTSRLQHALNKNIIYIFHTVEEKKGDIITQRLLCEGSARNSVWQPCDLGAYFYIEGGQRKLGFTPTEEYFAKGCYGIAGIRNVPTLTEKKENNFLTKLFDEAREDIEAEGEVFVELRGVYDKAMGSARAIIDGISDDTTANKCIADFKVIEHALTSEKEAGALFKAKVAELGLVWNKEDGAYVFDNA